MEKELAHTKKQVLVVRRQLQENRTRLLNHVNRTGKMEQSNKEADQNEDKEARKQAATLVKASQKRGGAKVSL